MKAKLIKKKEGWYNLYNGEIGIGSTHEELQLQGYKLSLKNCQAIERGYDLDELAVEYASEFLKRPVTLYTPLEVNTSEVIAFQKGFQKAIELMGDKKFSEDDVISMIEKSRETGLTAQFLMLTKQQTEWDVEIEMEVIPNFYSRSDKDGSIFTSNKKEIPKLDSTGCLILKRI